MFSKLNFLLQKELDFALCLSALSSVPLVLEEIGQKLGDSVQVLVLPVHVEGDVLLRLLYRPLAA